MTDEPERIAKFLARRGVASRRDIERMIADKRICLNGTVLQTPAVKVTQNDKIEINGKPAPERQRIRLWRYYKPVGLVTSSRDEKGRRTVFDSLPDDLPRLLSIGRLDINSEGLLLLTNDGALKRRLELPSTGWLRKYRVRVNGKPSDDLLAPLRTGLTLDGERFRAMEIKIDRQQGANAWLSVSLREGKNREIRRAFDSVGLSVNRLIRVSYGSFHLEGLEAGGIKEIKARVIKEQLGLKTL